jgi:class 3 adenylate cyclase/tetratricopeptide (TPR) repeat protein
VTERVPLTGSTPFPASERLKPYVSGLAIDWLRDEPDLRHRRIDGSLAFVDISGFTSLTERLSRKGKVGAEEMNDLLNSTFTDLLSVAYDFGAAVIKWGGDAVLLLFTGDAHPERACRAAWEMQQTMRAVGRLRTSSGRVTLRMSVGINSGSFDFFRVGTLHQELIVAGPAATLTVAAETAAEAGEIVISSATAAALEPSCIGSQRDIGNLLKRPPSLERDRTPPVGDTSDIDLVRCVPVALSGHLLAGGVDAEHRPLTVAFVHFDGTDDLLAAEGPEALADVLERCLDLVEGTALEYKVTFFDTDIAANGGKIMLVSGAPSSAGNDEERMLRSMRAVLDAGPALPLSIGVNQGRIFAADFGPPYRRTYSLKGDAVNLAARVMAKAEPGQLLATDVVLERSRSSFETQALAPFRAKGKAEPVVAHAVRNALGVVDRGGETTLIGRRRELATLLDRLAGARLAEGSLVEIVAEPGMGKSTLLAAAQREAPDIRTVTVQCDEYEASTPYYPFGGLLRDLLELGSDDATFELEAAVSKRAPQLLPWVPLIATTLGIETPETSETATLDERFRKEQLELTVVELLGMLLFEPTLLIFEDVHWLDDATADLVLAMALQLESRPWLVVLTRREVGREFASDGQTTMRLEALGEEEATELLAEATADNPLPPHQLEELARRAGGNPLFLTELLATARSPEGLKELPDSVETLLMTQIDRLAPGDRRLLRSAAVVGASFSPELVEAADGSPFDVEVRRRLADFVLDDGDGRMRFRHALVRDAAYEGLPFRRRRQLHERVGHALEARADDPEEEAALLSLHFFHAHDFDRAWRYSRSAGQRAQAIYANVEAATFYERAVEAARHLDEKGRADVPKVNEDLGDVRVRLGEFPKAALAYRASRLRLADDPVEQARLLLKEGKVPFFLARFPSTVRWLNRGLRVLASVKGPAAAGERARIAVWLATTRQRQRRPKDAIIWCRRAIVDAEDATDARHALGHAYVILDLAYQALGRSEEAIYLPSALAIFEELRDLEWISIALNNMGGRAYEEGRWNDSLELARRAVEAYETVGDRRSASVTTLNIAEILLDQGRLEEAEPLGTDVMRVFKATKAPGFTAHASILLGRIAARSRRFAEARSLLDAARALFLEADQPSEAFRTDAAIAECLLLNGEAERAIALIDATLPQSEDIEGLAVLQSELRRLRGCALLELGRSEEARDALEDALRSARRNEADFGIKSADYEVARTLDALVRLGKVVDDPSLDELSPERDQILAHLGIVALPELPVPA